MFLYRLCSREMGAPPDPKCGGESGPLQVPHSAFLEGADYKARAFGARQPSFPAVYPGSVFKWGFGLDTKKLDTKKMSSDLDTKANSSFGFFCKQRKTNNHAHTHTHVKRGSLQKRYTQMSRSLWYHSLPPFSTFPFVRLGAGRQRSGC